MDCPDFDCREDLITRIGSKVGKFSVWLALCSVGIPLFVVNLGVWSEVSHSEDKFVNKTEMEGHIKDIAMGSKTRIQWKSVDKKS